MGYAAGRTGRRDETQVTESAGPGVRGFASGAGGESIEQTLIQGHNA
jgi:hypothetical protein